jgi:hypothetical protein
MEWVLVVIIVVLIAVVAMLMLRQRRSSRLREGFGPEYDRVVEERGDRRAAESELDDRRKRREELDIRPLDEGARERYAERWRASQRRFVDEPSAAVQEADTLVASVMRERGYPMDDFEQRAADVSVDHPKVVEHYRAAHEISTRVGTNASTEDMRQAVVHYRALFAELLRADDDAVETPPMPREAAR